MFDDKIKSVTEAVKSVIGLTEGKNCDVEPIAKNEEIDPNVRTKDTTKGQEPTKQKDDVGPGSDGKSTKVKYRAGPLNTEGFKEKLINSLTEETLDESLKALLDRYLKSRGYNPLNTTKDKKIAITKSNEYKKWLNDHQFEEHNYDMQEYSDDELTEMVNEVLSKDASAGDWIHDFVHSDDPKFKGKSQEKRKKMALAAYYAHQKEEVELEEGKRPEGDDSPPWVGGSGPAQPDVKDKGTSGTHTPMSRVRHLARIGLKKVEAGVLGKTGSTNEEVGQVNEISSGLASRYLSKKRDRDYKSTGPHSSERKEPQTIDQAMKDGKNTVRALRIIQKKKVN